MYKIWFDSETHFVFCSDANIAEVRPQNYGRKDTICGFGYTICGREYTICGFGTPIFTNYTDFLNDGIF